MVTAILEITQDALHVVAARVQTPHCNFKKNQKINKI